MREGVNSRKMGEHMTVLWLYNPRTKFAHRSIKRAALKSTPFSHVSKQVPHYCHVSRQINNPNAV